MRLHPVLPRKPAHESLVAVAVVAAQVEVHMRHSEAETCTMAQMQQCHRVAAAANGQQHLLALGEEMLPVDIVYKARQHQRMIILRIRRSPFTSMP